VIDGLKLILSVTDGLKLILSVTDGEKLVLSVIDGVTDDVEDCASAGFV